MGGIPPEVESAVFPLPPLPPTPASLSPRLMAPPVPVFDVPAVDVFAFSTPESPASVLLAILELPSPPNRLSRSELEQHDGGSPDSPEGWSSPDGGRPCKFVHQPKDTTLRWRSVGSLVSC